MWRRKFDVAKREPLIILSLSFDFFLHKRHLAFTFKSVLISSMTSKNSEFKIIGSGLDVEIDIVLVDGVLSDVLFSWKIDTLFHFIHDSRLILIVLNAILVHIEVFYPLHDTVDTEYLYTRLGTVDSRRDRR